MNGVEDIALHNNLAVQANNAENKAILDGIHSNAGHRNEEVDLGWTRSFPRTLLLRRTETEDLAVGVWQGSSDGKSNVMMHNYLNQRKIQLREEAFALHFLTERRS